MLIVGIWALAAYPGHISDVSDGVRGQARFFIFVGLVTLGVGALGKDFQASDRPQPNYPIYIVANVKFPPKQNLNAY